MKNNFVLTKNIRTEGDRRIEAQLAYNWEDEMHRQEDCSSNFQHCPIRSVNLIHEISEMLDVKPPKYFFYDGNDTTWGGYQNGSNIVMRISAPISTTIHEMAHYIDDVHEKHRTGYGHGSSFKEILSLINIELGYWSRGVFFDERDYVRVFHTYMPKATVEKVRDEWDSGLKKILEAYEKELQAEEERDRQIKEAYEQKALERKRAINAIMEILMECLDISTIKSTLNQNMESGHYPCFQYYRAIFGNQPVLNWDHWDDEDDIEDYFVEDWLDELTHDIPMLLLSRDKDPKETLISHFGGVESFIWEFTNWVIDREYEMAEEFAWYNNPHILYVIDHDAYLDNKHDFDKDFLEEVDAQRALYKEYCQQLTMTELKFKPLKSTIRRQRYEKRQQEIEKGRQAFIDAWDIDKTSFEILRELGKPYTPKQQDWLSKKAHGLRMMGYDVPSRVINGLTPSARRDMKRNYFALFWKQFDQEIKKKKQQTSKLPNREYLDKELLKKINAEGRTTQELLECSEYSRVTLLRRLSDLEYSGLISRSLQDYNGRGRGYLWQLN